MQTDTWQLQEAKSNFSQLVDRAISHQPQIVTRHGQDVVVVLSCEEYNKMTLPEKDLVTFFKESPLAMAEEELDLSRAKDHPRDLEW